VDLSEEDKKFQMGDQFANRLIAQTLDKALKTEGISSQVAFLQVKQAAPGASSQIFGILESMLEDFERNMKEGRESEDKAVADYEELKATATVSLKQGRDQLSDKRKEAAYNKDALSNAKDDLSATQEQRSADVEFLSNLKLQCNDLDAQMDARTQARQNEIAAVSE